MNKPKINNPLTAPASVNIYFKSNMWKSIKKYTVGFVHFSVIEDCVGTLHEIFRFSPLLR